MLLVIDFSNNNVALKSSRVTSRLALLFHFSLQKLDVVVKM